MPPIGAIPPIGVGDGKLSIVTDADISPIGAGTNIGAVGGGAVGIFGGSAADMLGGGAGGKLGGTGRPEPLTIT